MSEGCCSRPLLRLLAVTAPSCAFVFRPLLLFLHGLGRMPELRQSCLTHCAAEVRPLPPAYNEMRCWRGRLARRARPRLVGAPSRAAVAL